MNYIDYIPSYNLLFAGKELNRELILDFFMVFTRLEYTLKISGLVKPGRSGEPAIQWGEFTKKITGKLNFDNDKVLLKGYQHLMDHPPQNQKYDNGLKWKNRNKAKKETNEKFLMDSLKTIRNNLFHGGKEINRPLNERDELLIKSALIVLGFIINIDPEVRKAFTDNGPNRK